MKPQTLNDIFFAIVGRRQERVMLVREASQWDPISFAGALPECVWNGAGAEKIGPAQRRPARDLE